MSFFGAPSSVCPLLVAVCSIEPAKKRTFAAV
jgi:hypothetical protein